MHTEEELYHQVAKLEMALNQKTNENAIINLTVPESKENGLETSTHIITIEKCERRRTILLHTIEHYAIFEWISCGFMLWISVPIISPQMTTENFPKTQDNMTATGWHVTYFLRHVAYF
ncbi:hypothetical protein ACJX0J_010396 [Zea mays]